MLSLTINGVDFTAKWRVYESSWTMRAWQGESAQSSFVIDDDDGSIDHANLAAKKIVEVWEDASGSSKCMYRGRVANKTLGIGTKYAPGTAMRWTVLTEDYNVDLRGIEVQGFERGEETDDERVEAVRLEYLNGGASVSPRARTTTNLDGTYIGSDPLDAAPLFDEKYTDTDPLGVLTRIVEMTGRVFFVYLDDEGDGELVYFNRASDADDLLSDIEVVDDGEVEAVDDVTTFAAYKGPQAGDHGGQNIMTGGSVRYQAGGFYRESNIDGRESTYDKWEVTLRNDNIRREEAAEDYLEANVDASEETFTYLATIDMRAEYAHLIRAGMRLRIKRKRANQTVSQRLLVVSSEHIPVKPDGDGEALYRVNLEVGRPINPHTTRSRFNIPIPPNPSTPGTVTTGRLYYTGGDDNASGLTDDDYSGSWDVASVIGTVPQRLRTTPQDTYSNSGTGPNPYNAISLPAGSVVTLLYSFPLSDSAAILNAVQNGATWRTVIRSNNRHGVGVNSGAQQNFPEWTIRVFRPGTGFIGTIFDVGDATATVRFDPGSATPSIPMQGAGAAVPSAVGTDYLVVDLGGDHQAPTSGATGFSYRFADQSELDDLPFVVDSVADQNSWLEASSAGGDGTEGPNDELTGDDSDCFAQCDHRHHVTRDRAPTPADDIQGYPEGTFWVQVDQLPRDTATEIIATYLSVDDTDGAAVWLLQSPLPSDPPSPSGLAIEEEDGSPSGTFDTLKVPNHSLTDNGDGTGSLAAVTPTHGGQHRLTTIVDTDGSETLDLADGNVFDVTLTEDITFTFSGATSGVEARFRLIGHWATFTPTFPASVIWPDDTEPTWSTGADAVDIIEFLSIDGGTTWYGDAGGSGTSSSPSGAIWRPLMAQDPDDDHWYVVVDGDGTAVMVET